jgi:hypothetical protein
MINNLVKIVLSMLVALASTLAQAVSMEATGTLESGEF